MSKPGREGLVGHPDDPKGAQPIKVESAAGYGDPQTVDRIVSKLCKELQLFPTPGNSLDSVILSLKGRFVTLDNETKRLQNEIARLQGDPPKNWAPLPAEDVKRAETTLSRGHVIHEFFAKLINEADIDAPSAFEILKVCLELAVFLMSKNKKYGDSALKPLRILSSADPEELIRVRMDDKLNRMIKGDAVKEDEDVVQDFVGYWVLLKVIQKSKKG